MATFNYPGAVEHGFLVTKVGDLLSAWVDGAFVGSARDAALTSPMGSLYLQHPGDAIRDLAIADLSAAASAAASVRQPRQTIDLLALTDAVQDRITPRGSGKANIWERQGRSLVYLSDGAAGKVVAPVAIHSGSYEIEAEFERLSSKGRMSLDLVVVAGRSLPIIIGTFRTIHGSVGEICPETEAARGRVIVRLDRGANGEPDHVTVRVNDKLMADWQGDAIKRGIEVEPYPQFADQLRPSLFCLEASYKITAWTLRIFDGEATVLRGASAPSAGNDAGWQNAINLLPLIEQNRDAQSTGYYFKAGNLILNDTTLELPVAAPEQYQLEFSVTRISGTDSFAVGLVVGGHPCVLTLDGWKKHLTVIEAIDRKRCDNGTDRFDLRFTNGQPSAILITVKPGRILVEWDGKKAIEWQGDSSRLSFSCKELRHLTRDKLAAEKKLSIGAWGNTYRIEKALLRPMARADAVHTTPNDAARQNAINLLPLIDPQKDAVKGTWSVKNGELIVTSASSDRIQIPYQPPEEYDFRISFTPQSCKDAIWQILAGGGRQFDWCLGGMRNKRFGFEIIGERQVQDNPSGVSLAEGVADGRRYTSLVQVRKDGVMGFLDGRFITEWKTNYRDMRLPTMCRLGDDKALGVGANNSPTIFHSIEVREVTGKGTFTRGGPATADAGWQNAINLLPLIDPQKDGARGAWVMENGALVSDDTKGAHLEIPYEPPGEYDFRIEFTRGGDTVQTLAHSGRTFHWCMGVAGGGMFGFQEINQKRLGSDNPTAVRLPPQKQLQKGRRYISTVEVRNDGVRAFIDGEKISEWRTDYRDMGPYYLYKPRGAPLLGVGSFGGATIFHRIELLEVSGKGKPLRPAPAGASSTPTLQHSNALAPWLAAFCAEVAALPAEQQVARVVAKLKELNPGYDGKETHKIENGVVVELKFLTIAVADISPVRALTGLKNLTCMGGEALGHMAQRKGLLADLSPLRGLKLESIRCDNNEIVDLGPLAEMPLRSFTSYWNLISDLTPLASTPLRFLSLSGNRVSNLSPLRGMKLELLMCHEQRVRDISPIVGMPLNNLSVASTTVIDLSPVRGMRLNIISLGPSQTNLSLLAAMPLKEIMLPFVPQRDTALLRSIKTLKTINKLPADEFWKLVAAGKVPNFKGEIEDTPSSTTDDAFIREIAALPAEQQVARVVAKLKELNPGYDGQEEHKIENGVVVKLSFSTVAVADISPVRALSRLKELLCEGEAIPGKSNEKRKGLLADLSPLQGLKLEYLHCSRNRIVDLSPLAGMPLKSFQSFFNYISDLGPLARAPLRSLHLSGNKICDLSPLKGMALESLMCNEPQVKDLSPLMGMPLKRLIIGGTSVSDLSPLRGMRLDTIILANAPVSDLSPLAGMPVKEITCGFVPQRDTELLRSIKTLQKINNLPAAEFWKKVEAGEVPKVK